MPSNRRLRIAHYAESADEGSVVVSYIATHDVWDCIQCGAENDNREFCWVCSERHAGWSCDRCKHKNPRHATECEVCGVERPEEDE